MGQKTNPIGLRLGINKTWDSIWFDEKNFAEKLHEDILLRKYIISRTKNASVSKVQITRTPKKIVVTIHTARPGIVIGRGGAEVEALKKDLKKNGQWKYSSKYYRSKTSGIKCRACWSKYCTATCQESFL